MKLYHYAGCSTCRKARAFLSEKGVTPTLIDLVETPPSAKTLAELHRRSGLSLRKFFNTSGQSYRDGAFSARLPEMDEEAQLAALAADGKLVKRPILDTGGAVLVGFSEAAWTEAVGG